MFQGKDKIRNLIWIFLILVGATIYYFFFSQPGSSMYFSQENNMLTFSGPKNTSAVIAISEITALTLEEEPDYGEKEEGGTLLGGNRYGTWHSDSIGTYQAYVTTRVKPCIVISDSEKTIVFNYSNAETTRSLYEQLQDYIEGENQGDKTYDY